MTDAVFKACYAEWKVIKTRATVQLVFELPIERADEAYQALGGMPIAAHEVWCGIARLDPSKEHPLPPHPAEAAPRPASSSPQPLPAGENKQKRQFGEMPAPQQAGMLCGEKAFQKFLCEEHQVHWERISDGGRYLSERSPSERWRAIASVVVRMICDVDSRSELTHDNAKWSSLVLAYRLWQRHPELSDAS
jgi:hypothetical protein